MRKTSESAFLWSLTSSAQWVARGLQRSASNRVLPCSVQFVCEWSQLGY